MGRHWGLGILENGGEGLDSDWGTYVDRIQLTARLWGIYFELGYGWVSTGATSEHPAAAFGQPYNMSSSDDVTEISLAIFSKPLTDAERKIRTEKLVVRNKPQLDWGLYAVYRRQKLELAEDMWNYYQAGKVNPSVAGTPYGTGVDCDKETCGYDSLALINRDAWTVTPDIWLRLDWVPESRKRVRLELEAAAVFGHIGNINQKPFGADGQALGDVPMDIRSFGLAFEGEYQTKNLTFGAYAGYASGDGSQYFGFLDHTNFAYPNAKTNHNETLTSFYFNPDYRIDNILFRNVVGTVTDAWYVMPFVQYDLFDSEKEDLAGRLELLYARAVEADATPGHASNLGVGTNVKLYYQDKGLFYAGLEWSMLWPLDAFNLHYQATPASAPVEQSAHWSTALRANIGIMF